MTLCCLSFLLHVYWKDKKLADNQETEERDEVETPETTEQETADVEQEVSEERAREDEVAHDETASIMAAISELSKQVEAMRIAVDSFAELGGVIRETTEPDTTVTVTDAGVFDDDEVVIDDEVVSDIDNIVFDD